MSGEKRTPIQILQDDMRANRSELYSIQKQRQKLQEELKIAKKNSSKKISSLQRQLEERSQQQQVVVNSLKSDLKGLANRHNQQLANQRNLMIKEIQDLESRTEGNIENLRKWTQDQLEAQRTEYRRIAQKQQQEINILKRDIEEINNREENREQRAKEYIEDLKVLIKSTEANIPHERYAPGKLDRIKRQLAAAEIQLKEDIPAATIATIQSAHFDLMDLEEEVLFKETEYEMTYRTVADSVEGLFSSVRKNRNIQLEEDASTQEANYWTEGNYDELQNKIEKLQIHIKDNKHLLTTEQLNDFLEEIETLTMEQEELINEAVERIISSQLRAEMGDSVVETLEQQGYRVIEKERGYTENDQRNSYVIKLNNVAGTEIVTLISPDENTYENILSINTYNDEVYDDASKKKRNIDILSALRERGLEIGETECNEQSIEDFYDVENLLKKGRKKLPKKVLSRVQKLSSNSQNSKISDK